MLEHYLASSMNVMPDSCNSSRDELRSMGRCACWWHAGNIQIRTGYSNQDHAEMRHPDVIPVKPVCWNGDLS